MFRITEDRRDQNLHDVFVGDAHYKSVEGPGSDDLVASIIILKALVQPLRIVCLAAGSLVQTARNTLVDAIRHMGLGNKFQTTFDVKCQNGTITEARGSLVTLMPYDAETIKGSDVDLLWVYRAHQFLKEQMDIVIPSVRRPGSEIWFSWTREDTSSWAYRRFMHNSPTPWDVCMHTAREDQGAPSRGSTVTSVSP